MTHRRKPLAGVLALLSDAIEGRAIAQASARRAVRGIRYEGCLLSVQNIRVADIGAVCKEWNARGAAFLTPPINRGSEIRCYMRDPDGHLIEGEQSIGRAGS